MMDGSQFDNLARGLANTRSRRGVLKALAGAALGAVSGVARTAGVGANPPPKKCKYQGSNCKFNAECCTLNCCNRVCCGDGQSCCNGQCVNSCPAGQTLNSACTCVGQPPPGCSTPSQCPPATSPCQTATCIGGQCGFGNVTNGTNCDDGNACTTGTTCQSGVCGGGSAVSCDDGNVCTTDSCNTATGCVHAAVTNGTPCGTGAACQGGTCVQQDPCAGLNCDDGNVCTTDSCSAGSCVHVAVTNGTPCTPIVGGTGICDGSGNCVQCLTPSDCPPAPNVCQEATCTDGSCGFANLPGEVISCGTGACFRMAQSCVNGQPQECIPGPPNTEVCNGIDDDCDGQIDEGAICPSVPNASTVCSAGECQIVSCDSGFADCNGTYSDGCEVNTLNDSDNCGTCGHVCGLFTPNCVNGSCV